MLDEAAKLLNDAINKTESVVVLYDTTFNVGNYYVAALVMRQPCANSGACAREQTMCCSQAAFRSDT